MSRINGFIGRRDFLKFVGIGGVTLTAAATGSVFWYAQPAEAAASDTEPDSPDAALQKLLNGNKRFIQHKPEYPHQSQIRLQEVATVQHPFATLLSCADSRVPAEIIFDQGIGDLFDVRIAGNIVTDEALGSLEYAAALLGTPLIMVLGHERCGAVTAAVQDKPLPGKIGSFAKAIKPAVTEVKGQLGDLVENAVVANVRYQVTKLKQSELLTGLVEEGKLKIAGGRYDLDTGEVTIVT
ncbi:carbonic anhydrase [Gloeocapsopsis dulcis]|uniref:carbonic anhydrase n=1 Tax=Gloeocapsopsis dulcis AAB1 = 1H9 TaxID=1433147 RepID=A0A6N8FYA2_9CHRO|nr:carbonic anhydrase [Gloeocapsopsis dulcis]MUL38053.1 carbonic anhydrase [Gloeocapsopsis dulcis AAB1 = 1H9]WNN91742.1 carbonic anhydrase [Gloeocapsopsis dulcis]